MIGGVEVGQLVGRMPPQGPGRARELEESAGGAPRAREPLPESPQPLDSSSYRAEALPVRRLQCDLQLVDPADVDGGANVLP